MRTHVNTSWSFAGVLAVLLVLFLLPIEGVQSRACAAPPLYIENNNGNDTTACLPDCYNSPFSSPKIYKINIPPFGWFLVKYRTRYACNTWYDVYIDWIVPLNSNGVDPFSGYSMQYILEIVTVRLLKENPMQFPPLPGSGQTCWTNWRVIKGPCWSRINTGDPQCPIQYAPCTEQMCCLEPYQVCISLTNANERTVTKLSYGWSPYSCPYVPPANGSSCQPACGYPPQYNNY